MSAPHVAARKVTAAERRLRLALYRLEGVRPISARQLYWVAREIREAAAFIDAARRAY
jgi:hypothetical protein